MLRSRFVLTCDIFSYRTRLRLAGHPVALIGGTLAFQEVSQCNPHSENLLSSLRLLRPFLSGVVRHVMYLVFV